MAIIGSLIPNNSDSNSEITGSVIEEENQGLSLLGSNETNNNLTQTNQEIITNYFLVTRVIDGDTIEISTGERVRLICVDTPETSEYYYKEAKDYLTNLILNKEIKLEKDISETDMYGRLLRYIYTKEGSLVNKIIVLNGYAKAYPYAPDTTLCPQIQEAEATAKSQKIGIWAEQQTSSSITNSNIICTSNYYNCGDFNSYAEALEVYNTCGGASNDIHELDGDSDGEPCESLK